MVNGYEQDCFWRIVRGKRAGLIRSEFSVEWTDESEFVSCDGSPYSGGLLFHYCSCRIVGFCGGWSHCMQIFLEASLHGTESFGCCTKVFMIISNSIFTGFLVILLHSGY